MPATNLDAYVHQEFGGPNATLELLQKYSKAHWESYLRLRMASLPPSGEPEGALPRKVKELILTTLEVALGRGQRGVTHARKAVRYGASPDEVHEAVALCIWLAGMATYVDGGADAVRAAEDEARRVAEGLPFVWKSS